MPAPIYVPQDTRSQDLQNTIMQIMQMVQMRKQQQRQDATMQLSTIMELGGDPGAMQKAMEGIGFNPQQAASYTQSITDKDIGQIPSRDVRKMMTEIKGIGKKATAEAEAGAAIEPITTGTELARGRKLLPLKREEKEQDLDLLFGQKKKELDLQFEQDKKISEQIKIPEFKTTHDYLLTNQKDLAMAQLANDKTLEQYKRTLLATPTPKEMAEIEQMKAHSQYYRDMGEYHKTIRGQLSKANLANKDFVNTLKTHTEFMKNNASKFYDKGKFGKLTPHEYVPGSQEALDFEASMDAAGVKYQKSTKPGKLGEAGVMGWFGDKVVYIPVAPEIPKELAVEGTMEIKSATKTSVTLGTGRIVKRNPDGTVTINGKDYNVEED